MKQTSKLVDGKTTKIAGLNLSDFLEKFVYCMDEGMSVPDILASFTPKDLTLNDWTQVEEFKEFQLALLSLGCRYAVSHPGLFRDKWPLGTDIAISGDTTFSVEICQEENSERYWLVKVERWHRNTLDNRDVRTVHNLGYAEAVQKWLNLIHQNEYGQYKNLCKFFYGEEE